MEKIVTLSFDERRKMENVLTQVYKAGCKNHKSVFENNLWTHKFYGNLGDQVSFDGKFFDPERGEEWTAWVEINLRKQGVNLAKITTEHGFIAPGSMPFWTDVWGGYVCDQSVKPINDMTKINLYSSRYQEKDGVCETFYDENKKNQLSVYCAGNEKPTTLVNHLYQLIAKSKDHEIVKQKLSQLNLPHNFKLKNLDSLADDITEQIYANQPDCELKN